MSRERPKLAWARLNSDGWLLVGLLLFSAADLLHPNTSNIARLVGEPPKFQGLWLTGFAIAGVLMGAGFVTTRRALEITGRGLLVACLTVQTFVVVTNLGLGAVDSITRIAIWLLFVGLTWLRISTLRSPGGLTVHIPGRPEDAE